jgi:glycerol-3-phosphate acyltransferase PlsY
MAVLAAVIFALSVAQVSWLLSLVLILLLVPAAAWNILRYFRHRSNLQRSAEEAERQKANDHVRFQRYQPDRGASDRY